MIVIDGETRRYAAALGRRHFEGTVTLDTLFSHLGESNDPLIRALLEAAAHQPRRGFAGVSHEDWELEFWGPVSALLAELEKGADGVVPTTRVYPRSTFSGIVGWSLFTLFALAAAAENAVDLWKFAVGTATVSLWRIIFECVGLAITTVASLLGLRITLFRFWLFRTRHHPCEQSIGDAG